MIIRMISFTKRGNMLATMIEQKCGMANPECRFIRYTKYGKDAPEENAGATYVEESIYDWAGQGMEENNAVLFIGACGIAVRAIAPWVKDKLTDSPVLVVDESGQYVIPVLSGHVGGANALARQIAAGIGAAAVITTATDINHVFAVDVFAKKNDLHIVNREGIARISSKALAGKDLTMVVQGDGVRCPFWQQQNRIRFVSYPPEGYVDICVSEDEPEAEVGIWLRPKAYILGIGCKKGKEYEKLKPFIEKNLKKAGILLNQVKAVASIDNKREEEALLLWSKNTGIPFFTYDSQQLQQVEGTFHASAFVKEQVGVDNVCERAALCGCGQEGKLILEKQAEDGMTIAIAKRKWSIEFHEE